jgi:hypothetical protein
MDNGHTPIAESTDVRRLSEPSDSKSPDPQIPLELLNEIEAGDIEVESQEPSLLATHSGKGRDEDEATVVAENYLDAQPPDSHMATPENEKTKLQDQTNILPFKQLIIVFLGLSCALFCESCLFVRISLHYLFFALPLRIDFQQLMLYRLVA